MTDDPPPPGDFSADEMSYADAEIGHVRGHRRATDGSLAALTAAHDDALWAMFDEGLNRVRPTITLLVPLL